MEHQSIIDHSPIECCGCGVCAAVCPLTCIRVEMDHTGFYRAYVDESVCSRCGLCRTVCFKYPDDAPASLRRHLKVFTAYNNDDTARLDSPSGGVGTALSEMVLDQGYGVIGARLNPHTMDLRHVLIQEKKDLQSIRGSKYFQSYTPDAFSQIKKNKKLLVFGTPCQIAGIRRMVTGKKGFDNLILVDFKCAGVPSRLLVDSYFSHMKKRYGGNITYVNLRYKAPTWANFSVRIDFDNGSAYQKINYFDKLMAFYRTAACIGNFCAGCTAMKNYSYADIRLEDAWDFVPFHKGNYRKGLNTVVTFSDKGADFFEKSRHRLTVQEQALDYANRPVADKRNKPGLLALLQQRLPLDTFVRKGTAMEFFFFLRWYITATLKTFAGRVVFPAYCWRRRKKANRRHRSL